MMQQRLSEYAEAITKSFAGWLARAPQMLRSNTGIDRNDVSAVHDGLRNLQYKATDRLAAEFGIMGDIEASNDWQVLKSDNARGGTDGSINPAELMLAKGLTLIHQSHWQALEGYGPAAFPSRYAIWRFAVQCETAVADELVNLSAETRSQDARDRALALAQDALTRAAAYRVRRRVAYHAERSQVHSIALPAQNRVQTLPDFIYVTLAVERWCLSLLQAHNGDVAGLDPAIRITRETILMCEQQVAGRPAPARLAKAVQRLETQAGAMKCGGMAADEAALLIASEAERIFDYYDSLFEAADERDIFDTAQHLSQTALRRVRELRRVCGIPAPRKVA